MNDILEYNKRIAEFMGCRYKYNTTIPLKEYELWLPIQGVVNFKSLDNGMIMSYHKSWSWLMPVVEKIINDKSSSCIFNGLDFSGNGYSFSMLDDEKCAYCGHSENSLLEACYLAVCSFIDDNYE